MNQSRDKHSRRSRNGGFTLVELLVAMTAAAPVSLQIFLPALPAVQKDFGVSTGVVQLTLSLDQRAVLCDVVSFRGPRGAVARLTVANQIASLSQKLHGGVPSGQR